MPHDWYSGMVDPTKEGSFTLLARPFGELSGLFDDEFLHIGCDEVDFAALNQTESIVKYIQENSIPCTGRGFKRLIAEAALPDARAWHRGSAPAAQLLRLKVSSCAWVCRRSVGDLVN
eukprot:COSAG01_NODE_5389_length_4291_cov_3.813931_4_plen_118_part_00